MAPRMELLTAAPSLESQPAAVALPASEYLPADALPCLRAEELTTAATGIVVIICKAPGMQCGTPDYCRDTIQECYFEKRSK